MAIPPSLFGKKGAKLPKPTSGHHLIFSATFNLVGISFCHPATVVLAGRGGGQKPVSVGRQDHRGDTHTPDRQQHHTHKRQKFRPKSSKGATQKKFLAEFWLILPKTGRKGAAENIQKMFLIFSCDNCDKFDF